MYTELPTIEQIRAMSDPLEIHKWRDDIDLAINKIETDLEFSSDHNSDWDKRARSALAYHRTAMGHLTRRLKGITGKNGTLIETIEAKTKKKEIAQQNRLINLEQEKLSNERKIKHLEMERAKSSERLSFFTHFHKVAARHLSKDEYALIAEIAAEKQHNEACK